MKGQISFFDFWRSLLFEPTEFFKTKYQKGIYPHFYLMFGFFVLWNKVSFSDIDALPKFFCDVFEIIVGRPVGLPLTIYVLVDVVVALLIGYFLFWAGSWLYDLRIRLSKCGSDRDLSKFIWLYTSCPPALTYLLAKGWVSFAAKGDFVSMNTFTSIGIMLFLFGWVAFVHSMYISYAGVTTVTNIAKPTARIWFVYIPFFFYIPDFSPFFPLLE